MPTVYSPVFVLCLGSKEWMEENEKKKFLSFFLDFKYINIIVFVFGIVSALILLVWYDQIKENLECECVKDLNSESKVLLK